MTVLFEEETETQFSFDAKKLAEEVIFAALTYEGFNKPAQVSLTIVDDERIREINNEFRGIDKPTDVLSFPMIEYEHPGDFSSIDDFSLDPDTNEVILGDIIISYDHVCDQAKEYGHSKKREFAFLIVHSMLHLMGYDHMEENMRLEMEAHQKSILDQTGINRDIGD
ncbi:MAG: rRNA maturation RNase YbeY [Lachnospiraceae bacterium]|nr:rRNA maturation RNase YbeY [Lachnospiraceae bacterium]